jgi:hypothetical protein
MANILYEMSPLLGALQGKGTFGNLFGKADSIKDAADKAAKEETDKKAAFDKIASNGGRNAPQPGMRKGGAVKKYAKGGSVKSSASRRADGIAQKGKTRGKIC